MKKDISGSRIKELRIQKGISADELGRMIGKNNKSAGVLPTGAQIVF
jgi:transcriptional regulator with XRE-family HTH domain